MKQNYRLQASCLNCKHVCEIYDYNEGSSFFCNTGLDRPLSGSCAMNEDFNLMDNEHFRLQIEAWDKWRELHRVSEAGICDQYTRKS